MGLTVWHYLRRAEGDFVTLPDRHLRRFIAGELALPLEVDRTVRTVDVFVELVDRRALRFVRTDFPRYHPRPDGVLDAERLAAAGAAVVAAFPSILPRAPTPGVIDARSRFAAKTYRDVHTWKPTPADLRRLRDLLRERSGGRLRWSPPA